MRRIDQCGLHQMLPQYVVIASCPRERLPFFQTADISRVPQLL